MTHNIKDYPEAQYLTSLSVVRSTGSKMYKVYYLPTEHEIVCADFENLDIIDSIHLTNLPFNFNKI